VYTLPVGEGPKTVYVQLKDAAGNESVAISATITLDTTAPSGTVTINGGTAYTKERNVTLSFAGGDSGAAQMRFSVDATTWSDWEAYSETRVYTLPVGEGPKTVYVQLKDAAGNESVAISATITLDTTLPSGTVVISGGAALTKATTVTLTVYDGGSDATHMRFSDDSSIWSEWESFSASATKTYTLSGGDGLKTVYVQVKDAAGNESNLFSSTITLDTTPPSGEAAINGGAKVTSEATVNINLTDGDTEAAQMRFSSDNIIWTEWEAYKMTKAYTLPGRDGPKTVYVQFKDEAGNESTLFISTIMLDTSGVMTISIISAVTNTSGDLLTLHFDKPIDHNIVVGGLEMSGTSAIFTDYEVSQNSDKLVLYLSQPIVESEVAVIVNDGALQGKNGEMLSKLVWEVITPNDLSSLKMQVQTGDSVFSIDDILNAIRMQLDVVGEPGFDQADVQFWLGLTEPVFMQEP
jgi:hypothetical protein